MLLLELAQPIDLDRQVGQLALVRRYLVLQAADALLRLLCALAVLLLLVLRLALMVAPGVRVPNLLPLLLPPLPRRRVPA